VGGGWGVIIRDVPPLVSICVAFLLGTALGLPLDVSWGSLAWFLAFASFLFLTPLFPSWRPCERRKAFLLLAAFFFMGLGRATWAQRTFEAQKALWPLGKVGEAMLTVDSEPDLVFERTMGGHETGRVGPRYLPRVEMARFQGTLHAWGGEGTIPVPLRVTLRHAKGKPERVLALGDVVWAKGALRVPRGSMNPGGFDHAAYLKSKGVAYTFQARPRDWRSSPGRDAAPWTRLASSFRRSLEDAATRLWPYPSNALWVGLLLGGDQALPESLTRDFAVTGTVHILAVSGANTALVTGLVFLLLRVSGFRRKWASVGSLLALTLFVVMTGAPPSVCRAALWGALVLGAWILERRPRWGTLVVFSSAILVALNPFALSDLSFQLSYLAAVSLVVFTPWWRDRLQKLGRPLAVALAVTLSAQMGVGLLMAERFNQLAVYSIVANLLMAPLVGAATMAGLLAIVVSWILPALGPALAEAARIPLEAMPWLASRVAHWPAASFVVASPPWGWMVLFHGLLVLTWWAAWPREAPERPSPAWEKAEALRRPWVRSLALAWGLALIAALAAGVHSVWAPPPFRVTFLSVGHGNAVVVEGPSGDVTVVDGGRWDEGPAQWSPVVAYLRHRGRKKVSRMVSTHLDADHLGGLTAVMESFPVERVALGEGARAKGRSIERFRRVLRETGVPTEGATKGDRWVLGDGASLEALHPPLSFEPREHRENNRSLVLLLSVATERGTRRLLLPGDLEREGWRRLLRDPLGPRPVEGLLAAHHGRPSGEPLLAATALRPRWMVLSDSKTDPGLSRELGARFGVETWETAREGAVTWEVDREGRTRVRAFRGSRVETPWR